MDSLALVIVVAQIVPVVALFIGIVTAPAQARIAICAIESMARQPEIAGQVRGNLIVSLAMAETAGIYGLLIAFIMIFGNPFVQMFINYGLR